RARRTPAMRPVRYGARCGAACAGGTGPDTGAGRRDAAHAGHGGGAGIVASGPAAPEGLSP
ncbi:hypothetical protein ACWDE9_39425, partial [Streptomyces olivaceoviridis]